MIYHAGFVILTALLNLSRPALSATVTEHESQRNSVRQFYTQAHSLGSTYTFPARDGWTSLNVTDMQYKYRRSLDPSNNDNDLETEDVYALGKRTSRKDKTGKAKAKKAKSKAKKKASKSSGALATTGGIGGLNSVIGGTIDGVQDAVHGIGKAEPVIITWYVFNENVSVNLAES